MNREVTINSPELSLPAELAFMAPDAISQLRDRQSTELYEAGRQAIAEAELFKGGDAYDKARQTLSDRNGEAANQYVSEHLSRDERPELFDNLVNLVSQSSIHTMDSQKWYLGEPDQDGQFIQPETSGRYQLEQALQSLSITSEYREDDTTSDEAVKSEAPADLSDVVDTPEIVSGRARLDNARNKLAQLSVERRRKILDKGKKNKALEERFEDANQEYQAAHTELVAMGIAQMREKSQSEDSLHSAAIVAVIKEHGRFTDAEKRVLESDDSVKGRIAKFWAKSHRRFFTTTFVAGGVAGFGARTLLRTSLGVATGLGVGIGVGAALGTTRAALSSIIGLRANQITEQEKRAESDKKLLQLKFAQETNANTIEETFNEHVQHLHDVIASRVGHDRHYNQQRVVAAALIGAIGGASGGFIGGKATSHLFDRVGDWATSHLFGNASPALPYDLPTGDKPFNVARHVTIRGAKATGHPSFSHTDGFTNNVIVEHGHGYTTELQELAAQKNIHLSGADSFHLYQDLSDKFGGHLFTNDPSYHMSGGNYGISHPGQAHWNPAAIHEMHRWLEENNKIVA